MVTNFNTINIASGSLAGANEGLLFFGKTVKEAGLADVGSTNEGDF